MLIVLCTLIAVRLFRRHVAGNALLTAYVRMALRQRRLALHTNRSVQVAAKLYLPAY
jgi:hypothetical protein